MPDPISPDVITAAQLLSMEFPPARFTVDGLLPERLTILAGAPKLGKSWMSLQLCLDVAGGAPAFNYFPVEQGDALYAALEDSPSRLRTRLQTLEADALDNLDFLFHLNPLTEGGEDEVTRWIESRANPRLVAIDTYGRVSPTGAKTNDYSDAVRSLARLQRLALEQHVSILLIHHTRKQTGDDTFDEVLGSRGLTGVADSTWVLSRGRNKADAVLSVTGRDIEEAELALMFQPSSGAWSYLGPGQLADVTAERDQLLQLLLRSGLQGLTPSAIAEQLNKPTNAVQQMLRRALTQGQVEKLPGAKYRVAFKVNITGSVAA